VKNLECGHVLCRDHLAECAVGSELICSICHKTCGVCGRYFCEQHEAACRRCGQTYCRECVRSTTELCDTCALAERESVPVNLRAEPCGNHPQVRLLVPHFRWRRTGNRRYLIYIGQGPLMTGAIVVVERPPEGGDAEPPRVLVARRSGILDSFLERFTR
jgi:hypothetical protein